MPQPAARQGDPVVGTDTHILLVPTPTPLPFSGQPASGTSTDVCINGQPAATTSSVAQNMPAHIPPPSTSFSKPPTDAPTSSITAGSPNVLVA